MSALPTPNQQTSPNAEPLAVDAKQLGAMLCLSTRTIRQLDVSGKLPKPVRIGARSVRWPVDELRAWLAAGAPNRVTWETIRKGRPQG